MSLFLGLMQRQRLVHTLSELEFQPSDIVITAVTDKGKIAMEFDKERFRLADAPILLTRTTKIQELGFQINHTLKGIINDQLNYFLDLSR